MKKRKWKQVFKCKSCGKKVSPIKGRLKCCGHDEPLKSRVPGNRDLNGRLDGYQPTFNSGEVLYRHGVLAYMNDGNGNEYYEGDDDEGFDEF